MMTNEPNDPKHKSKPSKGGFKCELCELAFSTSRGLASHRKAHSKDTICPVCHHSVRYLGPHLRMEHAEDDLVRLETGVHGLIAELRVLRDEVRLLRAKKDSDSP